LAKALQVPTKQHLAALSTEQKEKEESARIIKQRTYLRIVGELWLVGVLRSVDDGISTLSSVNLGGVETHRDTVAGLIGGNSNSPSGAPSTALNKKGSAKKDEGGFAYRVLHDMLSNDMDQHINLPLVASFLKNYGQVILNIVPRNKRAAAEQHGEAVAAEEKDTESVVTPDIHALLMNLFESYYKSVATHLSKMHKVIKKMERHNNEVLFARGELSEENKQRYERATKAYEKLLNHTQT
jgi:regulator of nonsense transcripts 2